MRADAIRQYFDCIILIRNIGSLGFGKQRHWVVQVEPAGRTAPELVECGVVGGDAYLVGLWYEGHVSQP